jgi:hypothetical protein
MKHILRFLFVSCLTAMALPAGTESLKAVRRIYLSNLDPKFQEYLRLEFTRQFHGEVEVVLDRHIADAVLSGRTESQPSTRSKTGRRLGLDDVNVGVVDMLDRDGKVVLWTERAGDRNAPFGEVGDEKVAARLVKKLKRAMR